MDDFLKVIHSSVFTVGTSVSVGSRWTQTQGVPKKLQRVCKNQCWAILAFDGEPRVQIPQKNGTKFRFEFRKSDPLVVEHTHWMVKSPGLEVITHTLISRSLEIQHQPPLKLKTYSTYLQPFYLLWGQGDAAAGAGGKIIKDLQERYTELQCVEYCYVRHTSSLLSNCCVL